MTGCIVGARDREQGGSIARLSVTITDAQADAVWSIAAALQTDLEHIAA